MEQAREQELSAVRSIERIAAVVTPDLEGQATLTKLHRVPEIIVNNPEARNLNDFPEVFRIRSSHALPSLRILYVGAAVPFEAAEDRVLRSR